MAELIADSQGRTLMVEGPNDCHVVGQILMRTGVDVSFKTIVCGSDNQLLERIGSGLLSRNQVAVGIVVDADAFVDRRWHEVAGRLAREGIDVPERPDRDGTIIRATDDLPRIGVWIMPDNVSPGELEHFVAEMIPDDDPVWPLSQRYIEGIPAEHCAFRPQKETRAKVLAWIATREDPGFMGQAIGRGDLSIDVDLCQRFIAWLDRLFAAEDETEDLA